MRYFVPVLGLALAVAALIDFASLAEGGADGTVFYKGNIDCEWPIDATDVLLHLQAQGGLQGVSAYCDQYAWGGPGCNPGPAPSTNCDTQFWLGKAAPTSVSGGPLPEKIMDTDCDGTIAARDSLLILLYIAGLPVELPCEQFTHSVYGPID